MATRLAGNAAPKAARSAVMPLDPPVKYSVLTRGLGQPSGLHRFASHPDELREQVLEQRQKLRLVRRNGETALDARKVDERAGRLRELDLRLLGVAQQLMAEPPLDHAPQAPVGHGVVEERLQLAQRRRRTWACRAD